MLLKCYIIFGFKSFMENNFLYFEISSNQMILVRVFLTKTSKLPHPSLSMFRSVVAVNF